MLCLPADANGKIAALDVGDLGEAIAVLCETPGNNLREVELGGTDLRTMREHLAAFRCALGYSPALCLLLPPWLARLASHLCDLLHFSPFSYGHLELMRRDNVPQVNRLPEILMREPRKVGVGEYGKGAIDHGIFHDGLTAQGLKLVKESQTHKGVL